MYKLMGFLKYKLINSSFLNGVFSIVRTCQLPTVDEFYSKAPTKLLLSISLVMLLLCAF